VSSRLRFACRRTWLCCVPGRVLAALVLAAGLLLPPPARAADLLGCSFESAEELARLAREDGARVLDHRGRFLAGLGRYYATPVAVEDLPRHLVDALVTSEDRRFFEHDGVDYRALGRALIANLAAFDIVQGGSTLTQQTLENACFRRDPELLRKVKELATAGSFESVLAKREILYVYLNTIYFGRRAYGVQAAARVYFDKYAQALTPLESALLVQLIPAPNLYNPLADPKLARKRAHALLDRMVELDHLPAKVAARAKREKPVLASPQGAVPGYYAGGQLQAGWFATWAKKQAEALAPDLAGLPTLRTTLWPELQAIAAKRLEQALAREGKRLGVDQGAVLVMSPGGEILAMVGGRDFRRSQWNNATQAKRQPGSAFKLFVYLAALERGLGPAAPVQDEPLTLSGVAIRNFDNTFRGRIPLAEAFAFSSNPAAIRLARGHVQQVQDVARRLGITAPLTSDPGMALGVSELTLLDLTSAYAALANGGRRVDPRGLVEIRDGLDRTVWCDPAPPAPAVLAKAEVQAMRGLLEGVVRDGTGRAADPGFFAAGKTGTTDDYKDAWFIGFTDRFVAGVWLGNEQAQAMKGVTGGGLPARIWREIMTDAAKLPRYQRQACRLPATLTAGPT
jgi:penicillin-binding protein 1A